MAEPTKEELKQMLEDEKLKVKDLEKKTSEQAAQIKKLENENTEKSTEIKSLNKDISGLNKKVKEASTVEGLIEGICKQSAKNKVALAQIIRSSDKGQKVFRAINYGK